MTRIVPLSSKYAESASIDDVVSLIFICFRIPEI